MEYRITYEGTTPSKKDQQQIRRRRNGKPFITSSDNHKAWNTRMRWELTSWLRRQVGVFPLAACRRVTLRIFYADFRVRDNSNVWEAVADLLKDAGVLKDDNWKVTGETAQIPVHRPGAPGWELIIETEAPAP